MGLDEIEDRGGNVTHKRSPEPTGALDMAHRVKLKLSGAARKDRATSDCQFHRRRLALKLRQRTTEHCSLHQKRFILSHPNLKRRASSIPRQVRRCRQPSTRFGCFCSRSCSPVAQRFWAPRKVSSHQHQPHGLTVSLIASTRCYSGYAPITSTSRTTPN